MTLTFLRCNDTGSGLVISFALEVNIVNVNFENCGTKQLRARSDTYDYSAVYVISSCDIRFSETSFQRSIGRGLSIHNVNGRVEVTNCSFMENSYMMALPSEQGVQVGGGGLFTNCPPSITSSINESSTHSKDSIGITLVIVILEVIKRKP